MAVRINYDYKDNDQCYEDYLQQQMKKVPQISEDSLLASRGHLYALLKIHTRYRVDPLSVLQQLFPFGSVVDNGFVFANYFVSLGYMYRHDGHLISLGSWWKMYQCSVGLFSQSEVEGYDVLSLF